MKGAASPECDRLGQLFARAIDAQKSGESVVIPRYLNEPPPPMPATEDGEEGGFVWRELERRAVRFKSEARSAGVAAAVARAGGLGGDAGEAVSLDFVRDLFSDTFR